MSMCLITHESDAGSITHVFIPRAARGMHVCKEMI